MATDYPLALCGARDFGTSRLLPFVVPEYGSELVEFETFVFAPPTGEPDRWYTFPNLADQEAIAFRTYDSLRADCDLPFWTPHSAFRDPHLPGVPAHRRTSVEVSALCLELSRAACYF